MSREDTIQDCPAGYVHHGGKLCVKCGRYGVTNNCALANGDVEKNCQMCLMSCRDKDLDLQAGGSAMCIALIPEQYRPVYELVKEVVAQRDHAIQALKDVKRYAEVYLGCGSPAQDALKGLSAVANRGLYAIPRCKLRFNRTAEHPEGYPQCALNDGHEGGHEWPGTVEAAARGGYVE